MKSKSIQIENFGFDKWFQDTIDPNKPTEYQIARVFSVNKNSFVISEGKNEIFAEVTGKLMFQSDSPLDYPAVGDWVYAQFFDNDSFAVIHEMIPRKSLLKRKTAGKKIEFQLIAWCRSPRDLGVEVAIQVLNPIERPYVALVVIHNAQGIRVEWPLLSCWEVNLLALLLSQVKLCLAGLKCLS